MMRKIIKRWNKASKVGVILLLLWGIIQPTPVFAHTSMEINISNGAVVTTDFAVTLNLSHEGEPEPTEMRFANIAIGTACTAGVFGSPEAGWVTYSSTASWTLASGAAGPRKVCSQTRVGGVTHSDDDDILYWPAPYNEPEDNIELDESCGLDVVLVMDTSASVTEDLLEFQQGAFKALVDAFLPATPTRIALVEFNQRAWAREFSTPDGPVAFISDALTLKNSIDLPPTGTTADRWTNFDDAMFVARNLFTVENGARPDKPKMIIFSSDGVPNRHNHSNGDHGTTLVGSGSAFAPDAMNWAIHEANEAKAADIHILGVGITGGGTGTFSVAAIEALAGPGDVIISDFDLLTGRLQELAAELCGGKVTIHKVVDTDNDLSTLEDQITSGLLVQDWEFEVVNVSTDDSVEPDEAVTDSAGKTDLLEVTFGGADNLATLDIVETVNPVYPFMDAACSNEEGLLDTTLLDPSVGAGISVTLEQEDIVSCTFYNGFVSPEIEVTKVGDPTSVPVGGGPVTFTFTVTNLSDRDVEITSLTDDVFGTLTGDVDCQVGTTLAATGESGDSCSFEATFDIPALADIEDDTHVNIFTAEAEDEDGNEVDDSDDEEITYYTLPEIEVTKVGDPTSVPVGGGPVTFTFTVTNLSDREVEITSLTDDVFGTLTGDVDCQVGTTLAATGESGDSCSFEETFTIPAGRVGSPHVNTFTAEGEDEDGNEVSDSDDEEISYTDITRVRELPKTGFPPGVVTKLEAGAKVEYAPTDVLLEIPRLGMKTTIMGVPFRDGDWDLTWLWDQAGWLEGTVYPTAVGNSVITAHAYLPSGQPGPFADLSRLNWGDKVTVSQNGRTYTFEVREVQRVKAGEVSRVINNEEKQYAWLTLMTCQGYNEEVDNYVYRSIVRAVLVSVK